MSITDEPHELATTKPEVSTEAEHIEVVRQISRVPGNSNYYEKGGLRTEGDGFDHTKYNAVSLLLFLIHPGRNSNLI